MGKMTISMGPNMGQVNQAMRQLSHIQNGAPKAIASALNKTAQGVKTDTVRILAGIYTAKQKDIRAAVSVGRRAKPGSLTATVDGQSKKLIPLIDFRVRPRTVGKRRPRGGVTAEVKRGQSRKLPGGFIANLGGRPRVAVRKGRARLPIKQIYGPSIPSMMDQDNVAGRVMQLAQARLSKNLEHEISRLNAKR